MSKAQTEKLLAALSRKAMTATEIWQELGIARASARVFDLRDQGHNIKSTEITVRNRDGDPCRVALYSLEAGQMALIPKHPGRGVMAA
jgi:hypothetical protein